MADPHADQPVETAGESVDSADAAVVLCHGRGASAAGMLDLARELDVDGVAFLALQAARRTWYPNGFMEPVERNEPWLSSALSFVDRTLQDVEDAGVAATATVLVGFSQGGCLASTFVARNPRRYGGLAALSAGLIGPEGTDFDLDGDLEGTPVFLGCSDVDPHIPVERVHETRAVLEDLGADVTERIYEGMGHTVNRDELEAVSELVESVAGGSPSSIERQ